jgi:hypothetical protein
MKSMSRAFLILAATALIGTSLSTPAEAATIVFDNIVSTPTQLTGDIRVNGLNEATGGYGIQVAYSPADLTGVSFVNDPNNMLGDLVNPIDDFSFGFGSPGFLDLFVIATMTPAQLTALQGPFPNSFVLASFVFDRVSPTAGIDLRLLNLSLSNADGSATIPLGDVTPVPEPATMLLFGTGLSALAMRRRKASKSQQ